MRARILTALVATLLVAGCAGTRLDVPAFQGEVAQGDYRAALKALESAGDEKDVASMLDRGLLLQAVGEYERSNQVLHEADLKMEDLYTRSLSREAASLLTSDRALDYRASGFEGAYISYYMAWNYLQLGRPQDVLVEARRINERLDFRADTCPDEEGACGHDLFLRYFSGLLFEWGGEANDAYVAYKQADLASATMRDRYGVEPPADLGTRLVRLARSLGFGDEESEFASRYGVDPASVSASPEASVVVIFENGVIGRRGETSITIPIMKGETEEIARDRKEWSRKLAGRRHLHYEKAKLEYLLRVALPRYEARPPAARRAEFRLDDTGGDTRTAEALSGLAEGALDDAMGGILIRAITRGLTKYLATKTAEKEIGEGAGLLVNLFGAVTEGADTRSWRSLPYEIQTASIPVAPGTYRGTLQVLDPRGSVLSAREFPEVRVPEGGLAFVRYRSGL